MLHDLDEVLRKLLVRELPISDGEIDITFDQPRREWSSRLSRPTLNLFLHALSENTMLRETEWELKRNGKGASTRQRKPIRVDLHYMVTAWASLPEDEHDLLAQVLMVLFLHPTLPEELLPDSLKNQPRPIQVRAAQPNPPREATEIWSVLDNELRPAIDCTVTLALNPYHVFPVRLVSGQDLRFAQIGESLPAGLSETSSRDRSWMVGGTLHSTVPLAALHLQLVERGQEVPVQEGGRFVIGSLAAGRYTLEVSAENRPASRHAIIVPSPTYDLDV